MQRRTAHHHDEAVNGNGTTVLTVHDAPVSPGRVSSGKAASQRRTRTKKRIRHSGFSSKYRTNPQLTHFLLGTVTLCMGIFIGKLLFSTPVSQKEALDYEIPEVMEEIGDKSEEYRQLRYLYDKSHPDDSERSREFVQSLHEREYAPFEIPEDAEEPYDIYNCPDEPPEGYPYQWNMLKVLENWTPDDTKPRPNVYQGLCVFDYMLDYDKAITYRDYNLPFVVKNDPRVLKTTERWMSPRYLEDLLGDVHYRTEYSKNNHFMYWRGPTDKSRIAELKRRHRTIIEAPENWTEPTEMLRLPYKEWLEHAKVTDEVLLSPDHEHWYYRLIGCGYFKDGNCEPHSSEYLFDELPFFQPEESLYLVEPDEQKGIHCRFGMKGVIAENHFDATRNAIVLLGGERRYILAHPNQCENLCLYKPGHPSARHSAVDWSDPDLDSFPEFAEAEVNEVVLQAGDVMYLPTNWFHYIISLDINWQCNTRSGVDHEYRDEIKNCGF